MTTSVASMQSHSPARFKPAAAMSKNNNTTTMSTNQQQKSRVRQRSNNDEQKHHIVDKMTSKVSIEEDIRRMTENFEDEVRIHRADLERSITLAQQQLALRLEEITPTMIDSLGDMTFKQFVEVYGCDLYAAVRAIRLGTVEEANDEINRTIKKRKRIATAGSESANNTAATDEEGGVFHTGSPMKSRKNMRMAPPTPKMMTTTQPTSTFPRSASKAGLFSSNNTTAASRAFNPSLQQQTMQAGSAPTQITRGTGSTSSSRFSNATASSKQRASTSNAGNFVYKARPSMTVPTNFNGPRLPQTPKAFNTGSLGSAAGGRTAGKSTAKRLPRKHESIQAYSMNGSPLGMFDLAVEQAAAAAASSSAAHSSDSATAGPSSQSGAEEDWEILSNRTTASTVAAPPPVASTSALAPSLSRQASNTPLAKVSPTKLGRKPSHSAFKDKILASATKHFGGGSNMHNRFTSPVKHQQAPPPSASSAGYNLARPPTREEFTFQTTPALPSIPSQSNMNEKWEAMKADLAKMCPDPEQRKLFEKRYLEIMHAG